MGHTNSTANLSLPQFIGTDKPTWLGDVNGAFSALDSYAGTNDAAVAAAASDASSAISQAAAAVNTANTANTTAGNASTAATAAVTAANQANALSNQVALRTGVLADLHTTDKTSIVNAINEVKDAEGDLSSLNTTDKTSLVAAINEVAQGGGAGYSIVATSAANQTYAAQIAEIKTAYDNLTADQKLDAFILVGSYKYNPDVIGDDFTWARATSSNFRIHSISLVSGTYVESVTTSSTTFTNASTQTDTSDMILYARV